MANPKLKMQHWPEYDGPAREHAREVAITVSGGRETKISDIPSGGRATKVMPTSGGTSSPGGSSQGGPMETRRGSFSSSVRVRTTSAPSGSAASPTTRCAPS
jgi:hypothetical protein